jgi:hypothetical protein
MAYCLVYAGNEYPDFTQLDDVAWTIGVESSMDIQVLCYESVGAEEVSEVIHVTVGAEITSFQADPSGFDGAGGTTTVSWVTQLMDTCAVTDDDGNTLSTETNGTVDVTVAETTSFTLFCTDANAGEHATDLTVTVGPAIDTFAAYTFGDTLGAEWASSYTESCTFSRSVNGEDPTVENVGSSGYVEYEYDPAAGDVTLVLTCSDDNGTSVSETVVLTPPPTAPEAWTCDNSYYGTDDGCDCGCGALDPDCAADAPEGVDPASAAVCAFNNCPPPDEPGTVDPDENWLCVDE